MKCPVCGHKVRPSKKYPGKYLCDTCRKRFPASAVIPDDTDTRSARSSAHKHGSVSGKKRPAARQQAFFRRSPERTGDLPQHSCCHAQHA